MDSKKKKFNIKEERKFCFLHSQVAPNRVKVATDGNIFEDKTFFQVSLKIFLFTLR